MVGTLLTGCATDTMSVKNEQQAIDQVTAPFEEGAITITIQTDPDLNSFQGIANSCTLLVVQAQKASTLNKLLSTPFALKGLFSAAGAQDSILKVDRYSAMPGQSTTLHIDRSENSRYIAVIAGYYPFPQKQHMLLVTIPVTTEKSGWWHPSWGAKLAPMTLSIRLASNTISQFTGATTEPLQLTSNKVDPSGKED
ncbi:type VI secretion system lipoprotein TssJ [Enterobacteriaceae bacterium RIT711]|nr:type VI secretion system lipoprotein TssJ [Enterobacteriaceae bacterium RIT711]